MDTTLQLPALGNTSSTSTPAEATGLLGALWNDDRGFVITAELVMISTVVVLGLITGLACVRDAVTGELTDVANAIDSLNQSYYFNGSHGCWDPCCGVHSYTAGSCFSDVEDHHEGTLCFDGPCHPRTPCLEEPVPQVEPLYVEPPAIIAPPATVEPPAAVSPPQPAPDVVLPQATPPAVTESQPAPLYVPCDPCLDGSTYYGSGPNYSSPFYAPPPAEVWHGGRLMYPSPIW